MFPLFLSSKTELSHFLRVPVHGYALSFPDLTMFPICWFLNKLSLYLLLKDPFGWLIVVFRFSVVYYFEEVNSPSTTSALPLTVGLILFWSGKNLLHSLSVSVAVAITYAEFSLGILLDQWRRVFLEVHILILFNKAIRIFRSFVKIRGDGSLPKYK